MHHCLISCKRINEGLTVENLLDTDEKTLADMLRPVGFFTKKAKYAKKICQILKDQANGGTIDIPNTYQELIALPGIGPKMAHLIMSCAWHK